MERRHGGISLSCDVVMSISPLKVTRIHLFYVRKHKMGEKADFSMSMRRWRCVARVAVFPISGDARPLKRWVCLQPYATSHQFALA